MSAGVKKMTNIRYAPPLTSTDKKGGLFPKSHTGNLQQLAKKRSRRADINSFILVECHTFLDDLSLFGFEL